jgi:hypothetical protein
MGITYGFPQASFFRPQDRADADFVELWLKGPVFGLRQESISLP